MKTPIYKIVEMVAKERSKAKKIAILQKYDHPALRNIIAYAINPIIEFDLPPGKPPYTPANDINMEEEFYSKARLMENFVKGYKEIKPTKRESIFINMLENLHPEDAKLLLKIKDKKVKGVTKEVCNEAWNNAFTF